MYKTLCAAVLITSLAFMAGTKSVGSAPPSLTAPVIVASGKIVNQRAPFSTTIYTPGVSGVFRLSTYASINLADPASTSTWFYGFGWTDTSGTPQTTMPVLAAFGSVPGEFFDGELWYSGGPSIYVGGSTRTFQASKGLPITHSMTLDGSPDSSVYSVYYVLERIE
jgi:hypothetical protein